MKYIFSFLYLSIFCSLNAQLYDAQWVIPGGIGVTSLDFRGDSVRVDSLQGNMGTLFASACICDNRGNLLYYSNGFYVDGSNGQLLMNGDTLSPCYNTSIYYNEGEDLEQTIIFLPAPGDSTKYFIIHEPMDTFGGTRPATIYYSLIDKNADSGNGALIKKNIPILQNTPLRGGGMTACKHANGRDYWIVAAKSDISDSGINVYYKFLLTPDSIYGPFTQAIGPEYPGPFDNAYSKFSQDGSKYATGCYEGLVLLMDFDRCTGEFSNPLTIYHNVSDSPSTHPASGMESLEFSANGRFLYVENPNDLTQYDLNNPDAQDSVELYVSSDSDFFQLCELQLASNGKLYSSTYNGGLKAYHVINYPDSLGFDCNFVYGGQPTKCWNSVTVPNLINYNLGPLKGSPCDTVYLDTTDTTGKDTTFINSLRLNELLRVLPNPADKYLYVEVGTPGNYEFDLLNAAGQVVASRETRQVDNFDTEALASGEYILQVLDKGNANNTLSRKVIIQH